MTLEALHALLAELRCDAGALDALVPQLGPLPGPDADGGPNRACALWRELIQDLPFDESYFDSRFGLRAWHDTVERLSAFTRGYLAQGEDFRERYAAPFGVLALLLLTFVALEESSTKRRPVTGGTGPAPGHDCAGLCQPLLAQPAVQQAIRWVYHPGATGTAAATEWIENVDFATVRFLRHGTTSVILRGHSRLSGGGEFALKLIILPFLRIPQVAEATAQYASRYGHLGTSSVVKVWASAPTWILMDFVDGVPLSERLAELFRPGAGMASLDVLERYGVRLLRAMEDLELVHQDLSPSNIMVTDGWDGPVFTFIDLGRNYLYTHTIVGLEGAESRYIAPEVKSGQDTVASADLYSLGQLLIALSGVPHNADGTVPDAFYADVPLIARFIEDLVDHDAAHRQLIFRSTGYADLRQHLEQEIAAARAVGAGAFTGQRDRVRAAVRGLFQPLADAPRRLRRLVKLRRGQPGFRDPRHNLHTRGLLLWAQIAAVAFAVTALAVITWFLRDLGWSWGSHSLEALQRLADGHGPLADRLTSGASPDRVPLLDSLRAPDYRIPDLAANLPARIIGISYAITGAKYYENLFSGVVPLVVGLRAGRLSFLAVGASLFMRLSGVTAAALVLPCTFVEPRWWPIASAIGQTVILLCNWFAASYARLAIHRARAAGLRTVPPDDGKVTGLASFSQWTPSGFYYTLVCWGIGLLIYFHVLHDVYVYAIAVGATNLFLFYIVKCSLSAPTVRTFLFRATIAAERLRRLQESAGR